ncbi:hypothetical protein HOO68_00120 [Candidatus Gracilibacteria bacterium]|nr:hypothetical protein [Candidatus Gracilibacteria bacterium]
MSGEYFVSVENPKNIWYLGFENIQENDQDICIEWNLDQENKTECIDHDTGNNERKFTFPVLSDAMRSVSFRVINNANISLQDIVVYSIDTRASGKEIAFRFPGATAEDGIISRKEWGADETIRYADSPKWKDAYAISLNYLGRPKTQTELDTIKILNDRSRFLRNSGGNTTETTSLTRTENGHILVWPIEKVKQISRIVLHHTAESMDTTKSDEDMLRGIYAYHTLSNEWGDIAYNYIVGQRGKIYEGRAGGDYVVGAHALYNNMGTVGIAVLGNYNKNHLNRDQIAGIEKAVSMMATKYGITLSESKKGVIKCDTSECYPFQVVTTKSLIGHQDVGRTDCPGSDIYQYIPDFISRLNREYSPVLNPIQGTIDPLPQNQVMNMSLKKEIILPAMSPPVLKVNIPKVVRYVGQKFRVRLSYPDEKNIILATADGKIGKIMLDNRKIPMQVSQKIEVIPIGDKKISLKVGQKYYTGSELRFSHTIVRIDSWDRIPDWDKSGKYNDNLFRDTIRVLNKEGKLVVINDLPIEWYLKGLGEVSNSDLPEKIKVITIAARSYARYYMDTKNRKFSTNLYDGSDNPDEFQKYLGYGYESRSPNVAKLVDTTRSQVITYSGKLIKPWYHSSSDGKTLSALEYCKNNGSENCTDIPYLQSVSDPGSMGHTRSGHGVGISGIGSTYWATQGWDYKKIIQYYLNGVEIQRK